MAKPKITKSPPKPGYKGIYRPSRIKKSIEEQFKSVKYFDGEVMPGIAEKIWTGEYKGTYLQDIYYNQRPYYHSLIEDKFGISNDPSSLTNRMKADIDKFLAGKNYQQYEEMKKLLLDSNGVKVPLEDFIEKSLSINEKYNKTWFDIENDLINNKIQVAKKMENYTRLNTISPGRYALEYVATKDNLTREAHKQLNGFTAIAEDKRWQIIRPPFGYNCRCTIKVVRMDKADISENILKSDHIYKTANIDNIKLPKGLDNNTYSTGKFFTDEHPYIKDTNRTYDIDQVQADLKKQSIYYGGS